MISLQTSHSPPNLSPLSISTMRSSARRSNRRVHIACADGRRRLWRGCTLRHEPQLEGVRLPIAAVDDDDAVSINAARADEISACVFAERVGATERTGVPAIDDGVAG